MFTPRFSLPFPSHKTASRHTGQNLPRIGYRLPAFLDFSDKRLDKRVPVCVHLLYVLKLFGCQFQNSSPCTVTVRFCTLTTVQSALFSSVGISLIGDGRVLLFSISGSEQVAVWQ